MCLVRRKGDQFIVVEDRHDQPNVREVRPSPIVWIVQNQNISRSQFAGIPKLPNDLFDHEGQNADKACRAVSLRQEIPLRIGKSARVIEHLIDDRAHRCPRKGDEHLFSYGEQRVPHDVERKEVNIDLLAVL